MDQGIQFGIRPGFALPQDIHTLSEHLGIAVLLDGQGSDALQIGLKRWTLA